MKSISRIARAVKSALRPGPSRRNTLQPRTGWQQSLAELQALFATPQHSHTITWRQSLAEVAVL